MSRVDERWSQDAGTHFFSPISTVYLRRRVTRPYFPVGYPLNVLGRPSPTTAKKQAVFCTRPFCIPRPAAPRPLEGLLGGQLIRHLLSEANVSLVCPQARTTVKATKKNKSNSRRSLTPNHNLLFE